MDQEYLDLRVENAGINLDKRKGLEGLSEKQWNHQASKETRILHNSSLQMRISFGRTPWTIASGSNINYLQRIQKM